MGSLEGPHSRSLLVISVSAQKPLNACGRESRRTTRRDDKGRVSLAVTGRKVLKQIKHKSHETPYSALCQVRPQVRKQHTQKSMSEPKAFLRSEMTSRSHQPFPPRTGSTLHAHVARDWARVHDRPPSTSTRGKAQFHAPRGPREHEMGPARQMGGPALRACSSEGRGARTGTDCKERPGQSACMLSATSALRELSRCCPGVATTWGRQLGMVSAHFSTVFPQGGKGSPACTGPRSTGCSRPWLGGPPATGTSSFRDSDVWACARAGGWGVFRGAGVTGEQPDTRTGSACWETLERAPWAWSCPQLHRTVLR